jgi:acyl-coenzyme A synthetase/AMP-(fatty) acid ligase
MMMSSGVAHPLLPSDLQRLYVAEGYWEQKTLAEFVAAWATVTPDSPALLGATATSYAELDQAARRLAGALAERVGVGDAIVSVVPHSLASHVVAIAVSRLGAMLAPLHRRSTPQRVRSLVDEIEPVAVIVDEASVRDQQWQALLDELRLRGIEVLLSTGRNDTEDPSAIEGLISRGRAFDEFRGDPNSPMLLLATSGTTGPPKVTMQSENGMVYSARWQIRGLGVTSQDKVLGLGMYGHAVCNAIHQYVPLMAGAAILPMERWDPREAAEAVHHHGLTTGLFVTTHMYDWLQLDDEALDEKLATLRTGQAAGKPDSIVEEFEERFGLTLCRGIGSAEVLTCSLVRADERDAHGTMDGRPQPGTDIALLDRASGRFLEGDGEGELLYRGPSLFLGYKGRDDLARKVVDEAGYFHSADLGTRTGQQYELTGRLGDMIKRGGLSIYPSEMERLLMDHPAVEDAAIVGVPDDRLGERPAAVIVCKPDGELSHDAVIEYLTAAGVPRSYLPEHTMHHYALPRDWQGKLDRKTVRRLAAEAIEPGGGGAGTALQGRATASASD